MSFIPLTSAKIRRIHPQVNTLSRFFRNSIGESPSSQSVIADQVPPLSWLKLTACFSWDVAASTLPGQLHRANGCVAVRAMSNCVRRARARQPLYHGVVACHIKRDTRRHNRGISLTGRITTRPASVVPGRRNDGRGRKRGMSETDGRRYRGATGDANADRG
jgi:hypothetical protein